MAVRTARASWEGPLVRGKGAIVLGSGLLRAIYSYASRFESGTGTNPEELLGAALAACLSMALAANLEKAGFPADKVDTKASVNIEKSDSGSLIASIDLEIAAAIAAIGHKRFLDIVDETKRECPVAQALAGTTITAHAILL